MLNFILNGILWVLALYGLFEIIKTIIYTYTYTNMKSDGIYVIVAVKNKEKRIEGFIRSILFRFLYGKEDYIKDIIVTDLNSSDDTGKIINNIAKDYECIKVTDWRECKEVIDSIDEVKK